MSSDSLYAQPRKVAQEDCEFYHVMEIPGYGLTQGQWDLRQGIDDYLGRISFADQRVVELGPASGFLTFEMEKRGADVVAVEVPDDPGWDFVPYPASIMEPVYGPRRRHMQAIKNSFWFAHAANQSKAKLLYGDVYNLPEALGSFDVALMGSLLLHCHSPLRIVEQCAMKADTLGITETFYPELAGEPVCRLVPTRDNQVLDTWWNFSPDFFVQFLEVLGFRNTKVTTHVQHYLGKPHTLFTVVASK